MKEENHKNHTNPENKRGTPIIIKAISLFLILGSGIAILLYAYIFTFNLEVMAKEISIIKNPFISPKLYILTESLLFILIILGAIYLLYLKRKGILLILIGLASLILMNYAYFLNIDWLYLGVTIIIMLILGFNWKKFD